MEKIAIYGAGGFGREVLHIIQQINEKSKQWEFIGFFDDNPKLSIDIYTDYTVIGGLNELLSYSGDLNLMLAIGNPIVRKEIKEKIKSKNIYFPTLIHPFVQISLLQRAEIGVGCIIAQGNLLTVDFKIGDFVILNLSCTVGHDAVIGDYCSIMPSVNISGEVEIGESVFIGTGAKIINQKKIGAHSTIGAGAVVTKDIPEHCTAVGAPAVPIKFHR